MRNGNAFVVELSMVVLYCLALAIGLHEVNRIELSPDTAW